LGNWKWQVFLQDTGGGQNYLEWLMSAWGWTMSVALLALLIALVTGSIIGILRTVPNKALSFFGEAWTELFRNVPLLVQLFIWYHVLPAIFLSLRSVPSFLLVVFGLGFFTSARIAELTFFAQQAAEETSRGVEIYLAVSFLYFISAFAINRVAMLIEHRVQVPGMVGAGK
jgi:glutamate/aspartate transport system permease protein